MKRSLLYFMSSAVLLVGLLASCGTQEARIIPRGKLAKIYEEMLMTDQWISNTPLVRMVADTSLVYEPILAKYGYTKDDYVATVDRYMDDPERFSRIFRTTSELLDKRLKVLHKRKADYEAALAAAEAIKALDYIIPEEEMIYLFKEVYVHYYDSLTVRLDSLKAIYQFVDVATSDTTYEGLRMIVDSLDVAVDTVALKDTVEKRDTVAVEDTLRHFAGQAEIKGVIKDILHK